jgi:hypothetical protein
LPERLRVEPILGVDTGRKDELGTVEILSIVDISFLGSFSKSLGILDAVF